MIQPITSNDGAAAVGILLCLVLVGSSLAARRVPLGPAIRMVVAWVAIFGGVALLFAWRPDLADLGRRALVAADPASGTVSGGTLRVRLAADGHYWVRGTVDGAPVRFLIDSGATTTALSARTVEAAKLKRTGGLPIYLRTANGDVAAERVRVTELVVGPITQRGLPAVTATAFGDLDVLGMNFLSGLKRWGVEEGVLVLTP
ncbi:retropepsin-like aspartic protease family protein [Sphingomonas jatrophae]|uniref:Aspartyl protease family protein n=1 Tax=Sphingomonas jatrophae TaxID=1166337 RepID=A0A1I6JMR6_9SPHN|nr:TIGR02281 family clan AA aspartic protease [Sphingomonas jatrophae]SFR80265.1 aspartyl protease family protein [Sphingomonas jatrophae]